MIELVLLVVIGALGIIAARQRTTIAVLNEKLDERDRTAMKLLNRLRRLRKRQKEESKFISEPVPPDIQRALSTYPSELAAPTEQWLRDQRRRKVPWEVIRRRIVSNPDNPGNLVRSDEPGA